MATKTSLALALIILLSSTAGSAVASAVDIAHNDPMRYAIESYTAEFDVSSQEARRRLQLQTDLDAPIAEIVAVEGDRVAGFGIQHAPSFGGFVLLAGDEPPSPAAMPISDDAGGLIEITTGLRHSLDELRQALAKLPEEVRQIAESTDIDIHSNAVVLGVTDQATRAALDSWTTSLPVRTMVVSGAPSRLDANVYGGRPMSTSHRVSGSRTLPAREE